MQCRAAGDAAARILGRIRRQLKSIMEHRQLGRSGLKVPALSLGTGTFGGRDMFERWGTTDVREAWAALYGVLSNCMIMSQDVAGTGSVLEEVGR